MTADLHQGVISELRRILSRIEVLEKNQRGLFEKGQALHPLKQLASALQGSFLEIHDRVLYFDSKGIAQGLIQLLEACRRPAISDQVSTSEIEFIQLRAQDALAALQSAFDPTIGTEGPTAAHSEVRPEQEAVQSADESQNDPKPPESDLEGAVPNSGKETLSLLLASHRQEPATRLAGLLSRCRAPKMDVVAASTHSQLEVHLMEAAYDLLLLDFEFGASLDELLAEIRQRTPEMPVILVGTQEQSEELRRFLDGSVQDFLYWEHQDPHLWERAVRYGIQLKKAEAEANYDELTGLPNRRLLFEQLRSALAQADRRPKDDQTVAVLFLDLDKFKPINDRFGHAAGDKVLIAIAEKLKDAIRQSDSACRIGGDEFVILLNNVGSELNIARIATKILENISDPIPIEDQQVEMTASLGISLYPTDGKDAETLIARADAAMYQAKNWAKSDYQFFKPEINFGILKEAAFSRDIRRALDRKEFVLLYQPQLDMHSGRISAVEALLRWNHPDFGLIKPALFLPFAEQTVHLQEIETWVLQEALRQTGQWLPPELRSKISLAVNFSCAQMRDRRMNRLLLESISRVKESGFASLIVEIRETCLKSPNGLIDSLHELFPHASLQLCLDDFGSDQSSIQLLRELPLHSVKIDQSLVSSIEDEASHASLVRGLISLLHSLNLEAVAEGV
ncbi:MAG TPA: diguanylate cyclase, partial [Acidobacteriota bacterium]|nr:diguanylate cyclase [Acidobacteriota bacterium]